MDQTALYEEDIYAWSQHQARVLRGLAGSGLRLPNDLDLEHVAEEIEEVGNEQRFAVESNLIQAFIHLVKLVASPEDQAARHWTKETRAFLFKAARRWRPSMRRDFDHEKLWSDACRLAVADLKDDGLAPPSLPEKCPFGLEELVGGEADPRDLAARLSASVGAGGRAGSVGAEQASSGAVGACSGARTEGGATMPEAVSLADKLGAFAEHWSPKIVATFNGHDVMVVRAKGEFVWHSHPDTDDLFLVLKGRLAIQFRDAEISLGPGDLYVVPRGVEHRPVAEEEAHLLLIEPRGTPNTGDEATAAVKTTV